VTNDVAKLQDAKGEEAMEHLDPFYQLGRNGSGWWLK